MTMSLFSTYRQGENRVTATFLAVLERLSLPNIDRILGALLEDNAFNLVTFENQPKGKKSRPTPGLGRDLLSGSRPRHPEGRWALNRSKGT